MGAFAATIVGAWLVYRASAQGIPARPRPRAWLWRSVGILLLVVGARLWIDAEGIGAGFAAALTELMLAWVALPYIAWWRRRGPPPGKRAC